LAKKLAGHGRRWFAFLLCRTVDTGFGLDVDRLLSETPLAIFEEWRALYGLEPWAEERADLAAGVAVMHNIACHGAEPKGPRDYMPYLRRQKLRRERPQSAGEMQKKWDAICETMERRQAESEKTCPP
jgi:hypothetical protein